MKPKTKVKTARSSRKFIRGKLEARLADLELAQLIRPDLEDEQTYVFKHAFTQEAAYDSLLHHQRRQVHGWVAATYEAMYSDQLDDHAALLAEHYASAGDDAKTLEYSIRAGDAAARVYAHAEAIAQYSRAAQIAGRSEVRTSTLARIYVQRGRAFELSGRFEHALANYEEMETVANGRGEKPLQVQARLHRATVYVVGGPVTDFAKAHALAAEALVMAQELGDKQAEAKAYWNLMLANRFANEGVRRAIEYGERSAAIGRQAGLTEQLAFSLHDLALAYHATRNYERSLAASEEAVPLWRALDNLPLLADALSTMGGVYLALGDLGQASRLGEEAYVQNHSIGNAYGLVTDSGLKAAVHGYRGQIDRFIEFLEEFERHSARAGAMLVSAIIQVEASMVFFELSAWDRAETLAQRALQFFDAAMPSQRGRALTALARIRLGRGDSAGAENTAGDIPRGSFEEYCQWYPVATTPEMSFMLLADLALARGETAEALRLAEELLNGLEKVNAGLSLPMGRFLKARVLAANDRLDEARVLLVQACAEANTMGTRWWLPAAQITLGQIEERLGHAGEAAAARGQALQTIEYIAAHSPADIREPFLARPDVRSIMSAG